MKLCLKAYMDPDYVVLILNRRSTLGDYTFLRGYLDTWQSKNPLEVTRSSVEAEFQVVAHGICELLWLKIIFDDLKIKQRHLIRLYCDNKFAFNITHNLV